MKSFLHKIPFKRILFYLLLFSVLVFLYNLPKIVTSRISINKIVCKTQYGECSDFLETALSSNVGKSLRQAKEEIKNYLSTNPSFDNYILQYSIPDTLKVEVMVKKAVFAFKVEGENPYLLTDREGVVLEKRQTTLLPVVVIAKTSNFEQNKVGTKEIFAASLLEKVNRLYSVSQGSLFGDRLSLILPEGAEVIFPLEGDIDVLVGSLRLIFSRLNDDSVGLRMFEISQIDLRYKNPVLRKR